MKEAWTRDTMQWKGKYIDLPEIQPLPKPIQKPHPPFYAAGGSPDSFVLYAKRGMRMLGQAAVKPLYMALHDARTYHQSWGEAGLDPAEAEFALLWGTHCAPTTQQALATATDPVMWYVSRLQRFFGPRKVKNEDQKYKRYDWWTNPTMESLLGNDMVLAGDPEACIQRIKKAEAGGINHVMCQFQIGGLRHEQATASMELFAREVMPEFKKAPAPRKVGS
jgi:alkanesulfonate monooxygenase SsuD/methylene tetrahydromethanopterin reductase-like flavin-dependent oxidoreductase (luciferase family)